MFNERTLAILKRELRSRILSKSFIIITLSLPALMILILGFQTFVMTFEGDEGNKLQIVSESPEVSSELKTIFEEQEFVKDSSYALEFLVMNRDSFNNYLEELKNEIIEERLTGVLFVPGTALESKKVDYYSKTTKNFTLLNKIEYPLNTFLIQNFFRDKNLSNEDLAYARRGVDITGYKVAEGEEVKEEGFGNLIIAYLFTFLLYISLLLMGALVMQSVIEEKSSKIVEVLLSSVSSQELMTGKIIGSSITGLLQMTIWLSPLILLISTSWFILPPEVALSLDMGQIGYFLFNFFIGLVIFIGLYATVGAIFDNPQDAQSGVWPIMLLIILPFFLALSLMKNPTNLMAEISSMLPFANIIVMPARMTLISVPAWQLILAVVVNILTILLLFPVAGKIYRVGILRTGKKPKWSEVIKWLKYKY